MIADSLDLACERTVDLEFYLDVSDCGQLLSGFKQVKILQLAEEQKKNYFEKV